MLLTAAPMATALPDLGARVLERLANAELVFGSQSVFGLLNDEPTDINLGGMAVQARRKVIMVMSADLVEVVGGVTVGAACSLHGDPWEVAQITERPQTSQTVLLLERA